VKCEYGSGSWVLGMRVVEWMDGPTVSQGEIPRNKWSGDGNYPLNIPGLITN
jgi:hypothetical protein